MISDDFSFLTAESGRTPQETENNIIKRYEELAGTTLYPADPVRLFLKSLAYTLSVQNAVIDYAAKQNLLAYASGLHLDHLGELMGVKRQEAKPAKTLLKFGLSEALGFDVSIPKGTRAATKDGEVIFQTLENGVLAAGETNTDILAECSLGNEKANGLRQGQISEIVDPLPYVTVVENSEDVTNGDETEDDEHLRERIRLAPETFTVAGSMESYVAQTKNASSEISAVTATSPTPGIVDIRFVLKGGELPNSAMIELVQNYLSAEDVRPLTDFVQVSAPDIVEYEIACTWFFEQKNSAQYALIQSAVNKAVENYVLWQKEKPGRDINPSELTRLIMQAGAKRVEITSPAFEKIEQTQIAKETNVQVTFGGVEVE